MSPRVLVVAGVASGVGKTSIALGLMAAGCPPGSAGTVARGQEFHSLAAAFVGACTEAR